MLFLIFSLFFDSCISNNNSLTFSSDKLVCLGGTSGCIQKYQPWIIDCNKDISNKWICESHISNKYSLGNKVNIICNLGNIENCKLEYYLNINNYNNRTEFHSLAIVLILVTMYLFSMIPRNPNKAFYGGLAIGYTLSVMCIINKDYYVSRSIGIIYNTL